jgi:hypothetical protein
MKLRKYTKEQLEQAVLTSVSLRQVLEKLNVKMAGGNYSTLKKAIKYYNLNTDHFTGMNLKGRSLPPRRRPIKDYLTKESGVQSNKLRKYLLDENVFQHQCSSCNLTSWLDSKIPLELDHIDGDNMNNELSNLRLLCPNCHVLTPTYRGKNIRKT